MSTRTARPEASSAVLATLGVATFVLGLMALVLSPLVVGGLLGLVGITLGLVQVFLGRVKRALAVWGIALSVVGVMGSVGAGITYYRWYLSEGQEVGAHEEEASGLEHWAGAPVPALSLTSLEGEALDTEALKGRRVVLNFWATWCKACREEIPHLNKLATEASSEITVIGISNEPEETLRAFARENALSYKVVSADDLPAPFHERPGIPTTAFIDKNGMIEEAVLGYRGRDAPVQGVTIAPMYEHLPGGDLVEAGLRDLGRGIESASALLVTSFAARLRHEGVAVPEHAIADPEHRLYGLLAREDPDSAHGRYNALVRRMVSFSRALPMPELADAERVRRLMRALGERADAEGRVYFTGGATAVLEGWRERTIAADIQAVPDSDRLLQAIPHLKESLRINVEIASPAHFIPETPGWQERSRFIERHGKVSFFHFDFYAQALAKIERGEQKDLGDVREMVSRDQVEPAKAWGLFREIEPKLPLSRHRPDAVPARRRRRPGTRSERIEWIA